VEGGHAGELAAALAYWAWRWQPLEVPIASTPALPLPVWAERLMREARTWGTTGPLISIRLDEATHSPNFTMFHMMTGLRALRVLLPWLDGADIALVRKLYWRGCS